MSKHGRLEEVPLVEVLAERIDVLEPELARLRAVNAKLLAACQAYMRDCSCHFGGVGPEGLTDQPCELCEQAKITIAIATEPEKGGGA